MGTVIELSHDNPSYNGDVLAESNELATALDQYWRERRTRYEETLERQKRFAEDSVAERDWRNFCDSGPDVLDKYVRAAVAELGSRLHALWGEGSGIAREAQRAFEKEASAEMWLPFSVSPMKFVCLSRQSPFAQIRQLPSSDHPENYELGKAHLVIRWRDTLLCMVFPTETYVTFNTFVFTKNDVSRSTEETVPKSFTETFSTFRPFFEMAEQSFAPVRTNWEARESITQSERSLRRIPAYSEAWARVQIPDAQKLDILRRIELFESGDPAAPHGLLLYGPTGTGKSMIARTIAETASCDFQKLSLPDLKKENLGASGRRVRDIWNHARRHRPAIIFIDECDSVFARRGGAESDVVAADVVQAFLPEWDGIEKTSGIMVIGATNRRDLLDDAIISRFGWEAEIGIPGSSERRHILEQELKAVRIELQLPEDLGSLIQGMSGRDIRNIAAATKSLAHPQSPTLEHLYEAVKATRKRGSARVGHSETWDTLPVDEATLERLKLTCALLRDSEKWSTQGITRPKSLLLTGPDTGLKKQIAQVLGNESGLTLLAPTLSDLKANILGESGNRIKLLFDRARSTAPAILFLDRLENITPHRGTSGAIDPLTNEIIGQLIQESERAQDAQNHIFLLGSTSSPEQVDPAVRDCFHDQLVIGLPGRDAKVKLFTQLLSDKKLSFPLIDGAVLLAQLTEHQPMGSRDVENLVHAAEQKALLRAIRNGGPEHYVITLDDFGPIERA
jgi:SpoVK/Ycf46/Vps4 family AAA+-type ATPase